ncbi:MAG: hypothetical protein M3442_14690 [Chloroflexota bacterium]|nr:hypothetical protein [Chloroflexota bacterium]
MTSGLLSVGAGEKRVFPPGGERFIVLTLEFRQEDGQWLGRCRELGTSTFADTLDQVREELADLVMLHLSGLDDTEETERVFQDRGIRLYSAPPPPSVEAQVPAALGGGAFIQASILPLRDRGRPHVAF